MSKSLTQVEVRRRLDELATSDRSLSDGVASLTTRVALLETGERALRGHVEHLASSLLKVEQKLAAYEAADKSKAAFVSDKTKEIVESFAQKLGDPSPEPGPAPSPRFRIGQRVQLYRGAMGEITGYRISRGPITYSIHVTEVGSSVEVEEKEIALVLS